jgi:predicted nucleic acid-binding protein
VRFWDSSALLPLVSEEAFSGVVAGLLREDGEIAVWWGTWPECSAAVSRLRRENSLHEAGEEEAWEALDHLASNWIEQSPTDDTRLLAMLVSKRHPLKAADTLQIAAALRWGEGETNGAGFVCLDGRLRQVASDEGFEVLPATLGII